MHSNELTFCPVFFVCSKISLIMPLLPYPELLLGSFWFVAIYQLSAKPGSGSESPGKEPILPSRPCCRACVRSPSIPSAASAAVLDCSWHFLHCLPIPTPPQGSLLPASDSLFLILKFCISELNLHLTFLIQQYLKE